MTRHVLLSLMAASPVVPPPEPSPMDALRESFLATSAWIVEAARRVPAERFAFRPAASVRTLGQLIGHVVDGNAYYCGRAAGKSPDWVETVAESGASKDELIRQLEASTIECGKTYHQSNASRIAELVANLGHVNLHYGNLVTYLRILGLTPPSS